MTALVIDRSEALRFTRVVGSDERLPGSVMAPMAGSKRVDLASLQEVEEFFAPRTVEELLDLGTGAKLHYVDPARLVSWVRDVIGDADLAGALEEVTRKGSAYGLLVPELKQLLAERLEVYREAIGEHDQQEE